MLQSTSTETCTNGHESWTDKLIKKAEKNVRNYVQGDPAIGVFGLVDLDLKYSNIWAEKSCSSGPSAGGTLLL